LLKYRFCGILRFMPEQLSFDGLVIKSNLARPILKRAGAPNPGHDVYSRLHYYGREMYFPEPSEDLKAKPHIVLPDECLCYEPYSVYGFEIPDPIRLRLAGIEVKTGGSDKERQHLVKALGRLSRGVSFEIPDPQSISLSLTGEGNGNGIQWQVSGEAFTKGIDESLMLTATGVKGHSVSLNPTVAGFAILETLG
jgi:hypothetical protein